MNKEELKSLIPNREPMLLVDEVNVIGDNLVKGSYLVKGDEFFLQGHFPGNPIVPGVILCEIMAQSSCLLMVKELEKSNPFYAGIDKVRFKKNVRPGDKIEIYSRVTNKKAMIICVHAEAKVNGELCVSGDLAFALINKSN